MDFNEYQIFANQTDQQPETGALGSDNRSILVPLLGLASEAGELLGEHKKWIRDGESYKLFPERVKEELGDILWYLANVATKHGLDLGDIAKYNLSKIDRRWGTASIRSRQHSLLDEGFPESERLPRRMEISIRPSDSGGTMTFIDGKKFGDPLTDNRYEDDGYRFHDIFHLSYACVLGWSPTVRALLRRKRKSNPKVDEVEDGGRALVIEEGIAAMVFSYAERRNYLEGAEAVDYNLLRTIKDMTSHLEVSCRTEGDWERAILTGFKAWRKVRAQGTGTLLADFESMAMDVIE